MEQLVLGDLRFRVRWSTRRKTMGLTVERDGSLTLAAPPHCPTARLIKFAKSKTYWVYTQIARRDLLRRPHDEKSFISGEGFSYLGRTYRLLLVDDDEGEPLRLRGGRLELHRSRSQEGAALLRRWYVRLGQVWLRARVLRLAGHAGVDAPPVQVQDLGYRWGSCGRNGRLYLNWQVMTLPPSLVDYVIAHELVHLKEPHHTPRFWRQMSMMMPDYSHRRDLLAKTGGLV